MIFCCIHDLWWAFLSLPLFSKISSHSSFTQRRLRMPLMLHSSLAAVCSGTVIRVIFGSCGVVLFWNFKMATCDRGSLHGPVAISWLLLAGQYLSRDLTMIATFAFNGTWLLTVVPHCFTFALMRCHAFHLCRQWPSFWQARSQHLTLFSLIFTYAFALHVSFFHVMTHLLTLTF